MQISVRTVFFLFLYFSISHANASIVLIDNLQTDAAYAEKNRMLLLVMVTLPTCSICEYVKEDHIEPMIKAGDFNGVAVVRELSLEAHSFIDFNGKRIDSDIFASRYNASFSPAILFLSPTGEELHEPMIGMSSRDYYGFYLNRAIKKSAKLLSEKK